tara:strand:+ start:620 stop:1186 length:567 start_codon:yes stop_codon:yes gene_type:complete
MSVIIWCHGGCFGGGNSSYDKKIRQFLTNQGYTVISSEFRKDKEYAIQDIISDCKVNDNFILAGISSGGLLAHIVANTLKVPAMLICPVFKPHDRHEKLGKKLQKLQLDFFKTKKEMKEFQDKIEPPNRKRYCIFGVSDTRAPVDAISDWECKDIKMVKSSHPDLCKNPPLDFVLQCVKKLFEEYDSI